MFRGREECVLVIVDDELWEVALSFGLPESDKSSFSILRYVVDS